MRNLALRDDPDFDSFNPTPRPVRRSATQTAASQAAEPAGSVRALLTMSWRKLLVLSSAALLCAIVVNALFFQTARHPAPLFAGATPAPPAAIVQRTAAIETPAPPARPAELTTGATTPLRTAAQPRDIADLIEPKGRDPIAAIIRGAAPSGQVPAAQVIAAPAATDTQAKRTLAAQKALQKLGYDVTPDGVYGAGTKQALQKFERDRSLPATGEIAGRTQRELAVRSGIQIN